jgi:hypothetical protein
MTKMVIPWCEYDIGQERRAFTSRPIAEAFLRGAAEAQGLVYDDLEEEGLIGFEEWELD